ncbi:UDP binding domain-containing protein [Streptomyces sp. NPDC048566]|uniref:UDP binding domain-containing protein n=1 Tax=Streptomyces sp. NPDC048566 TaxID=3365569 RepID=UPI00371A165A
MTSLTTEPSRVAPVPASGAAPAAGIAVPATRHDHRADLLAGRAAACVWGLGHIGWSTVQALRAEGVAVVGYDVDPARAEQRGAAAAAEVGSAARMTSDRAHALAEDVAVHFVAVPTEREAEPYSGALVEVFAAIAAETAARRPQRPPLVIVESTLTPGTVEELLLPIATSAGLEPDTDLLLALAPRRDWFLAEGYGLRDLDRIYCGVGARSADAARDVLGLMCDTLHRAPSHIEGELVKCVENAYRHVEITLANQLSLAYAHVDMVEVLRLAGTKWNIGTFHPSFGTGGYCIPLSSRYLLRGAADATPLSLLSAAVDTDVRMRGLVAQAVAPRGRVLVLGLAYKGGIKVATLSPTVAITEELRRLGTEFSVYDPMYSAAEIEALLGPGTAATDLAEAVRQASTVLVVPDHPEFRGEPYLSLLDEPRERPLLILDNHGVWEGRTWPGHVAYRRAGGTSWLDVPASVAADAR